MSWGAPRRRRPYGRVEIPVMRLSLSLLVVVAVCGAVLAQDPAPPVVEKPTAPSVAELVSDLGAADYEVRAKASDALRKQGERARTELEQAARSSNVEQRTRARALLAELDKLRSPQPVEPRVERLRPQLDPRLPDLGEMLRGRDVDLSEAFERMRKLTESYTQSFSVPTLEMPGFDFRVGGTVRIVRPDGQILELDRKNGALSLKVRSGAKTDTYAAEDLAAFKKKFPEIYEKYADSGLFSRGTGGFTLRFGSPFESRAPGLRERQRGRLSDLLEDLRRPMDNWAGPGPRLGVEVAPVPEALRAHVDLPGKALLVERVAHGTASEKLGLRRFDLLLEVDGKPVGTAQDVRDVMGASSPPPVLTLKVQRKGRILNLKGARPVK